MKVNGVIFLCLLAFVPQSFGFNALIITNGVAGHVIPMFELAKGMHDHNITFLTDRLAETYIDFKTYPNLSSFRLIYTNDSIEALVDQKKMAREMFEYFFNHSLLDSLIHFMPRMIQTFGSSALIKFDRMKSLIYGLGEFLFQTTTASVLLAFRNFNYDSYRTVLDEMVNVEYKRIFLDEQRVKVENQFLDQKWILRQHRVSLFISHCGMGSVTEGLYFQKLILCLPLCNDQFPNAFMIDQLGDGQSLFVPPSPWKLLLRPNSFHYYTFTASSVTIKLLTMWRNSTYEKVARIMSLEIKHAGGVKRAVEEIEFFVRSNGDLDRYVPFPSTLPFYQRFLLDIIFIYMILPMTIMFCVFMKCCKRPRKEKKD
ncbi:unnamed protein product [Rotaria sordida]|uniref:UDP-glucuronosyltransferase n=1 Tax=Rotaria sordida TaxID=392033 RepID=A0A814VAA8_9BILA|nr:unnamed protein product [Rotaria sordida]CAF1457628.1 unnamed protein product [Rotaria sordida]